MIVVFHMYDEVLSLISQLRVTFLIQLIYLATPQKGTCSFVNFFADPRRINRVAEQSFLAVYRIT